MKYAELEWRDGHPYSPHYDDVYYSRSGGLEESDYVFIQQNHLRERFANARHFVIAETGFGSALNFALTVTAWQSCADAGAVLDYIGIESAPLSPDAIKRCALLWPQLRAVYEALLLHYPLPVSGMHILQLDALRVRLHLYLMDVLDALKQQPLAVDAWYLDGFAPAHNPTIWNQRVFHNMAEQSCAGATVSSYTVAGVVRRGLQAAGFVVEKCAGYGTKREMLTARLAATTPTPAVMPWFRRPEMAAAAREAVVVGAGLAGLAAAWALVRRGWRVTILDRHAALASAASGNPSGLVLPRLAAAEDIASDFYQSAFLYAIAQLDYLQSACAQTPLWRHAGITLGVDKQRADKLCNANDFQRELLTRIDSSNHAGVATHGKVLLLMSQAGWASPAAVCAAMQKVCGDSLCYQQADVACLDRVPSTAAPHWRLRDAQGNEVARCGQVILANAAAIGELLQTAWLPVHNVRGQLSLLTANYSTAGNHAYSFERFIAPALDKDNHYYCGAGYQVEDLPAHGDVALRMNDQQANLEFVERYFPGLFSVADGLQGRAGYRAVSDDRLPVAGAVPDSAWFEAAYHDLRHGRPAQQYASARHLPGLYVSSAHGSRGLVSSFICGEHIAALMESTPLPLSQRLSDAINPARFLIRKLRRGD